MSSDARALARDYVTFYLGEERFALCLDSVREIVRVPEAAAVPLTPPALLGLANLRGVVLPLLDLRRLMGLEHQDPTDASRALVTEVGGVVGLVVDRVARVIRVQPDDIMPGGDGEGQIRAEYLLGVVSDEDGLVKLVDVRPIVELEFSNLAGETEGEARIAAGRGPGAAKGVAREEVFQMVTFALGREEYGLEIERVQEIVRLDEEVTSVPRAASHVLGLMSLRKRLLGLVKLRRMFGLAEDEITDRHRVLVVRDARSGGMVGLVVDEVREVLTVPVRHIEALPPLLEGSRGEDRPIARVCRLQDGRRLVSVLAAERLLGSATVQEAVEAAQASDVGQEETMKQSATPTAATATDLQLVVFRLGTEEFGAPIRAVSEIIRVPEQLTAVPHSPAHVEGMVSLRGKVLPVVDLRARLQLPKSASSERQRILVLEVDGLQTGFIVDSVTEVLRVSGAAIEPAPRLSAAQSELMGSVANLREAGRMVMLMEPHALFESEDQLAVDRAVAA